jgi:Lipocalin-like domain
MLHFKIVVGCFLLLGSMQALAQQRQKCTGPQLGTWKLESYTTEDIATGQKSNLLGPHPSGFLNYGSDCRMYAILAKDGRKPPATFVPTDAERIDLYSGFIAYAGVYRIEGDKVSHQVDASWNQSWTGTIQVRRFKIDGNHLYITTLPTKNALTGKESSSVLVWTKVE